MLTVDQWKAFKFFDASEVKFPDSDTSSLFSVRLTPIAKCDRTDQDQQSEISCLTGGSGNVYLATHNGVVHTLSKVFKVTNSFRAHDQGSITHIKQPKGTSLLVTVAEDLSNEPTLKVWALDKAEKKTGVPRCLSSITIQNARKTFPVCQTP